MREKMLQHIMKLFPINDGLPRCHQVCKNNEVTMQIAVLKSIEKLPSKRNNNNNNMYVNK
jgi:hypothetical protein